MYVVNLDVLLWSKSSSDSYFVYARSESFVESSHMRRLDKAVAARRKHQCTAFWPFIIVIKNLSCLDKSCLCHYHLLQNHLGKIKTYLCLG